MKISRENYEIWFMDWLEGRLSGGQFRELSLFLEENPDLKKEFDELSGVTINAPTDIFRDKEKLKRSLSELPAEQFDLICAARHEGDLDQDQLSEFSMIIAGDAERKRTADLFSLTRLKPDPVTYPFRKDLHRRTFGRAIFRLALPAISAAAILALLLMTGVLRKRIIPATIQIKNTAEAEYFDIPASKPVNAHIDTPAPAEKNHEKSRKIASSVKTDIKPSENSATPQSNVGQPFRIASPGLKTELQIESLEGTLASGPVFVYSQTDEAEERSRIGKFLTRTFREKILEEKTPSDKPLRGYEIAEAGITGINKLLGWEMALTTNTDDNGKSSVNFNSRLLKFNTPVKNITAGE